MEEDAEEEGAGDGGGDAVTYRCRVKVLVTGEVCVTESLWDGDELQAIARTMGIESRRKQGKPPMITDPLAIRRVAQAIQPTLFAPE